MGHNESAPLRSFIFDNVKIAGELVEDISVFNQNEYVTDMRFTDSSPGVDSILRRVIWR